MKNTLSFTLSSLRFKGLMLLAGLFIFTSYTAKGMFQQKADEVSYQLYKGEVADAENGNPLTFASLSIDGTNISTVTNTEGQFSLKVPKEITNGRLTVSFLGYRSESLELSSLKPEGNKILLSVLVTQLSEVNIIIPKDAESLVRDVFNKRGINYFNDPTLMTAFYRETIRKRRRNVSLAEAVVNIYKSPYDASRKDAVELYKSRKSTDYSRLDTLVLKLQGGPYNTLFVDIMKYPEYIFAPDFIGDYIFSFDRSTRINDRLVYVVNFVQNPEILEPLYQGKLYIDAEKHVLTSAVYSLNITNKDLAAKLFVRKKPVTADVWPEGVAYRVDYREKDGRWYYGYSNVQLEFKIDWKNKLFNSVYTLNGEMAVTDWEKNTQNEALKRGQRIRSNIILSDEASGFSDPDFWGEYNIIEPDKSIESAIRKIQRQLLRDARRNNSAAPEPTP